MRRFLLLLLGSGLSFSLCANAAVVSVCDEASLRVAMSQGGVVSFGCSGTIILTQAITVSTNVALTGVGAQVAISGIDRSRLFNVSPGVEFQLASLQITHGLGAYGGAISNDGGRIVLDGVGIDWNNARSWTGSMFEGSLGVGGAIYSRGGTVIASNCVFASNVAFSRNDLSRFNSARGGAICTEGGTLQIVNCLFRDNKAQGGNGSPFYANSSSFGLGADAFGAAIYSSGTGAVQRCRFLSNGASGGTGGQGWVGHSSGYSGGYVNGAVMYNAGTLQLSECTFMNNVASGGSGGPGDSQSEFSGSGGEGGSVAGAVIRNQGRLSLVNCTFANNVGSGGNGGLGGDNNGDHYPAGDGGPGGLAAGGAIFNSASAAAFLTNCTVVSHGLVGGAGAPGGRGATCLWSCGPPPRPGTRGGAGGNGGTASGAGLYMAGGTSVVVHCTFDWNWVSRGTAGIGGPGGGEAPRTAPTGPDGKPGASLGGALCVAGGNVQAANSIFSRSEGSTNCSGPLIDLGVNICSDQSACFTNSASMRNQDAGVQPLADNGGWTMTAALLGTSPALNGGSDAFAAATDQRGVERPQGKFCDVGAYEAVLAPGYNQLTGTALFSDVMVFSYIGEPAVNYALDRTVSLAPPINWVGQKTNTMPISGVLTFTNTPVPGTNNFWRVRSVP